MKGKLFPVPATEMVTFTYDHDPNTILTVSVTDVLGKTISAYELKQDRIDFSVSTLAAGFYYVKVCEAGAIREEHKLTIIR